MVGGPGLPGNAVEVQQQQMVGCQRLGLKSTYSRSLSGTHPHKPLKKTKCGHMQ